MESSSLLYSVTGEGLVDKVTFEWIPEGSEQASHMAFGNGSARQWEQQEQNL